MLHLLLHVEDIARASPATSIHRRVGDVLRVQEAIELLKLIDFRHRRRS